MKKFLVSILSALLVALCVVAAACGTNNNFTASGFKDFGAIKSQGGFVAQTENYVVFINGVASNSGDNSYGAPVKGSLMAIKNSDFAAGKFSEAKIVVPKLFAATDYSAGFFIQGDYVYYGTPSTDKDSSGNIATSEIEFMKAKLDGSAKPERLFKYSALSVSYRIVNNGDSIFVVYYDSVDSAIKEFSAASGTVKTIAKTDAKNNDKNEAGEYLSLGEYKFLKTKDASEYAVVYALTVYDQQYFEKEAEESGYSRSTAKYNYVYAYKAGGDSVKILDGKEKSLTYAIKHVSEGFAFFTEKDINSKETVKGCAVKELASAEKYCEIKNSDLLADTSLIVALDEVYALDSEGKFVYTTSLLGNDRENRKTVILKNEALSSILLKHGNDLYFYNTENNIVRVEMENEEAKTVRVSLGSVNASWYKPQLITVDGKDYLAYCDTTTVGSSYVYAANLASKVVEEDTDDDGENDLFYLEAVEFCGKKTPADAANVVTDAVNKIPSKLTLVEKDGALVSEEYENAQKIYDGLSEEVKKFVSESNVKTLSNCKKAIELAEKFNVLFKVRYYDKLSEDEKTELKAAYETAKAARQELIDKEGETNYKAIKAMISDNINSYFQDAKKKIEG